MKRKNIYYLFILVVLVTVTSCKKQLDQKPQGLLTTETFFKTEGDALKAINAVYNILARNNTWSGNVWAFQDIASDDADQFGRPSDAGDIDNFNAFPSNPRANYLWKELYDGITRANLAIENIPNISMEEKLKARLIGEAKFLRAFYYFTLHQVYGEVPVFTKPLAIPELNRPQSTLAELWGQIEKDLNEAANVLPASYSKEDIGRVTKGAAYALLAKSHLYQREWSEVVLSTDKVTGYSLEDNFQDAFWIENGKESVLEVQFAAGLGGTWMDDNLGNSITQWQAPGYFGGWDSNPVTEDLYNAYSNNDKRRDVTILKFGQRFNRRIYDSTNATYKYEPRKHLASPEQLKVISNDNGQNLKLIRYSEVLLMKAEANAELGNMGAAEQPLNVVRVRAGLDPISGLSQAEMIEVVRKERRLELALEWNRFSDLVRWGIAGQIMRSKGKSFVDGKNERMPIPQREIDLTGGALRQNPGY